MEALIGLMIIVQLMGGLGNQMFQYATARRLADRHKTEVFLDMSFLENPPANVTARSFALHHFNIRASRAPAALLHRVVTSPSGSFRFLVYALKALFTHPGPSIRKYTEQGFHFQPAVLSLPDNTYLSGYWQSERYFQDIRPLLLEEFSLQETFSPLHEMTASQIRTTESVAIHIRRGDYVTNPATNAYHGLCGLDYYKAAADRISRKIAAPTFFVFSDDPGWAKIHLPFLHEKHFVEHNGIACGHRDLHLMSLCRHHIIANSSFSWWGAWLATSSEKMVVAPQHWFSMEGVDTSTICPPSWIRI